MYQKLIESIANEQKSYGEQVQPACTPKSLIRLREEARRELSFDIPDEYTRFLSITDGLEWNGLVIYASETTPVSGDEEVIQGFVEANLEWREFEPNRTLIFFADSDISQYVYSIPQEEYQTIDRVSADVYEKHPSFDHMVTKALKTHL